MQYDPTRCFLRSSIYYCIVLYFVVNLFLTVTKFLAIHKYINTNAADQIQPNPVDK